MVKEPRILILEDLPTDAESAMRELRQAQIAFQAKRVDTKESFLQALKEFEPDIILSEYSLPQFNALDALGLLKKLNLDTPFILYTGSLTEKIAVKCMKKGAVDYILKSSVERLPSAVSSALEKRDARRAKEQAFAALRESEERYRRLVEVSPDAILVNRKDKIVFINDAGLRLLGASSADEIVGKSPFDIFHPDYHDLMRRRVQKMAQTRNTVSFIEEKIVRLDGTAVDVEVTATPLTGEDEFSILVMLRDITERKQAENKLRDSEEWLKALLDASRDGIVVEDDGEIVYINRSYAQQLKYDNPAELVGRHISEILPPDEAKRLSEFGQRRLRGDNPPSIYQFKGLCKDGTLVEVEGAVSTYVIGGKKYIMTAVRDITERKLAEEELKVKEAQLVAAQRIAQVGSWTFDLVNKTVTWSDEMFRIMGYKLNEIVPTYETYLSLIYPDDLDFVVKDHKKMMRKRNGFNHEHRLTLADGTMQYLAANAQATINEKGKVTKITGTAQDITARKLAEEAIEKSERQYRFLSEGVMHQVWTAQPDGNLDYVNGRTLEYFGLRFEQAINDGWLSVLHPDDAADCLKRWMKSVETGEYYEVEFRLKKADGTYRWHLGRATAGRDPDGKVVKWFGTNTDTHEQKLAEDALKVARLQLETALDAGAIATWNYDILNNRIIADKNMAQLFSVSPEEAAGGAVDSYLRAIHPDDRSDVEEDLAKAITSANNYEFDYRVVKSDGAVRSVIARGQIERDAAGNAIRMPGVIIDITEQKRSDAALRESDYKMRTLLGNMSEGLLQVDAVDSIEFVNNRFCEMLGYSSPDELTGKNWSQLILGDEEGEFIKTVNKLRRRGISDSYELQLVKKTGETIWALVGGAPIINAEGIITGSMGVFTDITERKRAEEQLLHDAFHDGLTGLANRTLFMNHLQMTIERNKRRTDATFAVLFLDFDRFKIINDSLGHAEGDKLLKQIARRLESSLRPGDLAARIGGDEFTILLPELDDESDALRIAERIQGNLKGGFDLAGREVFTSASIGIALSTAGHTQAEDMLRDADIAMYRAKAKGKAQYQVFDQEMHKDALAQLQLETEMRHALERGEFSVHYQPIISLNRNDIAGFEALVRWRHPTRGMVSPLEFIPAAEETGLILPLGKWILNESCRQLRQWQTGNPAASSLTVSVNLSCKQFMQADLAEQVAAALETAGLDAGCLKLEITESHIMENTETAIAMMNQLRNLGVEISLDDFGTGYSSLSYLHRFPVDYLKIDRSFVNRMTENKENAEIVYTIIKLAQNLKMKVVAEGIETNEQVAQLKQLGCEYGQGYFFSKPLEAEAASLFIDTKITNSAPVLDSLSFNVKLEAQTL